MFGVPRSAARPLKHGKLLDAAHIIGDHKPHGIPVVENGLSPCKIHHAAYGANLLGIPQQIAKVAIPSWTCRYGAVRRSWQ
jgi:putative restriction endonuclease